MAVREFVFDLAPSGRTYEGRVVWETAEELDAMQTLAWLNGGYAADGVDDVIEAVIPPTLPLNPTGWNRYRVGIRNADSSSGQAATWQSLTIADVR